MGEPSSHMGKVKSLASSEAEKRESEVPNRVSLSLHAFGIICKLSVSVEHSLFSPFFFHFHLAEFHGS